MSTQTFLRSDLVAVVLCVLYISHVLSSRPSLHQKVVPTNQVRVGVVYSARISVRNRAFIVFFLVCVRASAFIVQVNFGQKEVGKSESKSGQGTYDPPSLYMRACSW